MLGSDLRERRMALRLTEAEAGDLAGVSERFVRAVESGKGTERLDKVVALADALGLELTLALRS